MPAPQGRRGLAYPSGERAGGEGKNGASCPVRATAGFPRVWAFGRGTFRDPNPKIHQLWHVQVLIRRLKHPLLLEVEAKSDQTMGNRSTTYRRMGTLTASSSDLSCLGFSAQETHFLGLRDLRASSFSFSFLTGLPFLLFFCIFQKRLSQLLLHLIRRNGPFPFPPSHSTAVPRSAICLPYPRFVFLHMGLKQLKPVSSAFSLARSSS